METSIAQRLTQIHTRMEQACARCGRDPHSVELIAVSKKACRHD